MEMLPPTSAVIVAANVHVLIPSVQFVHERATRAYKCSVKAEEIALTLLDMVGILLLALTGLLGSQIVEPAIHLAFFSSSCKFLYLCWQFGSQ